MEAMLALIALLQVGTMLLTWALRQQAILDRLLLSTLTDRVLRLEQRILTP